MLFGFCLLGQLHIKIFKYFIRGKIKMLMLYLFLENVNQKARASRYLIEHKTLVNITKLINSAYTAATGSVPADIV